MCYIKAQMSMTVERPGAYKKSYTIMFEVLKLIWYRIVGNFTFNFESRTFGKQDI